jgi:hypothetical protein
MHPKMNPLAAAELQLVAALAKHLLSPSRFEDSSACAKTAAQDGLRCLAALDQPTRMSLPTATAAPQPSAAPEAPKAAPAAEATLAPRKPLVSRFGSQKQEYQSGLKDNSVIEALLGFHARTRSDNTAPLAGFEPQQILAVAAQPKKPAVPTHGPGTTRVFRARGER